MSAASPEGGWVLDVDEIEVSLSALEHYAYCPRQCALIHVEQTFDENMYTVRGRLAHERVHGDETDMEEGGVRVVRGIPLWSERLGLRGKADLVELRPEGAYPVEYKVGRQHGTEPCVQLCAQALCLEEMLHVPVPRGAIFYMATRRRVEISIDAALRGRTVAAIDAVRQMLRLQHVPPAPNDARCPNCSLIHSCLPSVVAETARLRGFQGALFHAWDLGVSEKGGREEAEDAHEA